MAQSEPVRLRVYRELVARLTVDERLPAARKLVDEAAKRCSSAESTTALAQWRSELDALDQALQARRQRQEAEAQDAYVQQLRSRHQQAVAQGDEAASTRYQELLSAAGGASRARAKAVWECERPVARRARAETASASETKT